MTSYTCTYETVVLVHDYGLTNLASFYPAQMSISHF